MSRSISCDLVVIGAGWSGAERALKASRDGANVVVSDSGNGMSALWSGVLDVYGPTVPQPPSQLPTRFRQGATAETRRTLDPARRLALLEAQQPDHPYAALGFDVDRVREAFAERMALLDIPGILHDAPVAVATNAGTVRPADFVSEGVGVLDEIDVLLGLEEWPNWSPEWTAKAAGRDIPTAWLPYEGRLAQSALAIAGRNNPLSDDAVQAIHRAAGGATALMPAVLGLTFEAQRAAIAALAAVGQPVRELAAAFDSPFGLRLMTHLRAKIDAAAERLGAVTALPEREGNRWRVILSDGGVPVHVIADELALEIDDAVPPAWLEPWLSARPRFPRNAANSPWQRHGFQERKVTLPC